MKKSKFNELNAIKLFKQSPKFFNPTSVNLRFLFIEKIEISLKNCVI